MTNKATLNLRIDAELKQRFLDQLKANHETATDIVTRAIEDYCHASNDSNDHINQYSNDSFPQNVTIEEEKFNELWEVINHQQRQLQELEHRMGKKCDHCDVEGISCQLPELPSDTSASRGSSDLGINELANFHQCSPDTLNKLIRQKTGGKIGDKFSYKSFTWKIVALNPRKFRQI